MDEINTLDIRAFIANAINKVFDTMLSMDVEVFDADSPVTEDGNRFRGLVDITGELTGSIEIQISEVFARLITASLHGIEVEEIESDEAVEDVIREMSNTLAGHLKANFHESGLSCELSIPSVTTGSDFEIETLGVVRDERLGFRHDQHAAMVELRIKTNGSDEEDGKPSSDEDVPETAAEDEAQAQTEEGEETIDQVLEDDSPEEEQATDEDVPETAAEEELPRVEAVGEGAETHFREAKWYEKTKVGPFIKKEVARLYAKRVLAVAALLVCFLGFYLSNERKEKPEAQVPSSAPPIPLQQIKGPKPASPIEKKLQEIAVLRDELSMKKKDIAHLKMHYQKGIEELEHEIEDEIRAKQVNSYQQAINDKKIELALRTIQRRQAYIQQLDQPYDRLHRSGEALLYLERLTKIENRMADLTTGINGVELMRRLDKGMRKLRLAADKLAFDMKGVNPQSLKTIWENIIEGNKKSGIRKKDLFQKENKNQEIWQEIFYGNFNRKNELTELSPEVAKCLSKWEGKDLSLNAITELPPELAKDLSQWQGEWLSLNGLSELSPDAAIHLSQWQGKWLSLNGLAELSPDAAMYLSQWKGKQLELIGLKRLAQEQGKQSEQVGLKYLAEWEKSGGRLFLPEDFRKKINK